MHPIIEITVDGLPVSGLFLSRLLQATVTLKEDKGADTINLILDAGGPPLLAVPRKKALITAAYGYAETGVEFLGGFTVDDVELECLPYQMRITGKSADWRSNAKEHKERHFDNLDLNGLVTKLAGEMGLTAVVDPEIGSFRPPNGYWFQPGVSNTHWLESLARRHNALYAHKQGRLLFLKKGSGMMAGGGAIGVYVITPPQIIKRTMRVQWSSRDEHKKVRAAWHDRDNAERKYEEAEGDPEAETTFTLRHSFGSQQEAKRAADAKAKDLGRNADSVAVTIEGDPRVIAGAPLEFEGVHPDVDASAFIIQEAQHSYSKKMGYRTGIQGRNPDNAPARNGHFSGPKIQGAHPKSGMGYHR